MAEEGKSYAHDEAAQEIAERLRQELRRWTGERDSLLATKTPSLMVGAAMQMAKAQMNSAVLLEALRHRTEMTFDTDILEIPGVKEAVKELFLETFSRERKERRGDETEPVT